MGKPWPAGRGGPSGRQSGPEGIPSTKPRPLSRGDSTGRLGGCTTRAAFNEATAVEPWRPGPQRSAYTQTGKPSTKPRPLSRGDRVRTRSAIPDSFLQRSTAVEPWRHDLHAGVGAAGDPSTKPRPLSRGDGDHRGVYRPEVPPSTKPRPLSRGDRGEKYPRGRVLLPSTKPRPLSRGDRPAGGSGRMSSGAFNEATAVEPWRPDVVVEAVSQSGRLQRSHGR